MVGSPMLRWRAAADSAGGLGDYVRQRRELGDRWAALGSERNLVLGSGAPDTPQKVAAIDAERSVIEAKTANIDTILLGRFPQFVGGRGYRSAGTVPRTRVAHPVPIALAGLDRHVRL